MNLMINDEDIKALKEHIFKRDNDKIIEVLPDEQAIDAYAQAIKAQDLLYNTNEKEEIFGLIESYCACDTNVEPGLMVAKAAFESLWTGILFFINYVSLSMYHPKAVPDEHFYKGLPLLVIGTYILHRMKNPVKRENDAKMRLLTLKDKLER